VSSGNRPSLPLLDWFGDEETALLFSEESLVGAWLDVERALASAQAELGVIPPEAAAAIEEAAVPGHVDLERLRSRTLTVGYPILPLLEQIGERSTEVARHVHWGATTQDIMDTGLAVIGGRALDRIDALACSMGEELRVKADAHRATVMPGRTHAQPAVPITFGGKLAVWLAELTRHRERLHAARGRFAVVQLFGAAGTAAALGPQSRAVRHRVAEKLGLGIVDVPWHTARDSVAEVCLVLASMAGTCGKSAREVIELSRPEIGEVREEGGHLRGASSTMPQKANPIASEAVVGLSIIAAQQSGALLAALQGTHERSAGEWQAEWDALPLAFGTTAGALAGSTRLLEGLRVFPERMRANLDGEGGLLMAEAAMIAVADVVGRATAHALVAEASTVARADGITLRDALERTLDRETLDALPSLDAVLDPDAYLGETDAIVTAAIDGWAAVTGPPRREAGRARP
jgi:3-carboxy-cis,cis-muconate cycloisomerase